MSQQSIAKQFFKENLRQDIGLRVCNFGSEMVQNCPAEKSWFLGLCKPKNPMHNTCYFDPALDPRLAACISAKEKQSAQISIFLNFYTSDLPYLFEFFRFSLSIWIPFHLEVWTKLQFVCSTCVANNFACFTHWPMFVTNFRTLCQLNIKK